MSNNILKPEPKKIAIIRHAGEPNKATTLSGENVERRNFLYWEADNLTVPCEHYDDHFVYRNHALNQPAYMCTCGSPAGMTPLPFGTPQGKVLQPDTKFVCLAHKTTGKHVTSMVGRKDYRG